MFDNDSGAATYIGPRSIRPGLPFIREVKFIDDFERNLVWVIGLDQARQFTVHQLSSPDRLVIDVG
jgi:hypothetical protein